MPKKKLRSLRCPICRKIVLRSELEFPFCSERCRLIDLGKWASGGYVISTPVNDPETLENAAREQRDLDSNSSSEDHGRRRQ
jgi:endogenous inhibitor of DNA gyrase (YacG/DUF329 family)